MGNTLMMVLLNDAGDDGEDGDDVDADADCVNAKRETRPRRFSRSTTYAVVNRCEN